MTVLSDLIAENIVEAVQADPAVAGQWLREAARHLTAADAIVAIDPTGAYVLAYDAARKSVAAMLLMSGHRVKSRPGAHQALARFAQELSTQIGEPRLGRLDRMRRNRNRSEYGAITFNEAEVREAIDTASIMRQACQSHLGF